MSCEDCAKSKHQRAILMDRMATAAIAHGYELWSREGSNGLQVLALPVAASHGTPQALVDTYKEVKQGLPRMPAHEARLRRERDKHSVKPHTRNEAGQISYQIDGTPPVELVFLPQK